MRGQIIMSIPTGKSNNNIPTPPNDDGDYVLQCVNGKLVWDKITVGFGTFPDPEMFWGTFDDKVATDEDIDSIFKEEK